MPWIYNGLPDKPQWWRRLYVNMALRRGLYAARAVQWVTAPIRRRAAKYGEAASFQPPRNRVLRIVRIAHGALVVSPIQLTTERADRLIDRLSFGRPNMLDGARIERSVRRHRARKALANFLTDPGFTFPLELVASVVLALQLDRLTDDENGGSWYLFVGSLVAVLLGVWLSRSRTAVDDALRDAALAARLDSVADEVEAVGEEVRNLGDRLDDR
ncbi:hypothetical protein [Cellulosimicrobium funkei]|uniref:hypothetical protein n=1 Tax=Cellulosimicrobium funkei TaxID=264251 RepID=UPI00343C7EAC